MTESELLFTMTETTTLLSQDFEYFITATFALIVVSYVAGDKLSLLPRIAISVLYLATVGLLLFKYQAYSEIFAVIGSRLTEMNSEFLSSFKYGTPATALRIFVYIAGSIATVFIIFRPVSLERSSTNESEGT